MNEHKTGQDQQLSHDSSSTCFKVIYRNQRLSTYSCGGASHQNLQEQSFFGKHITANIRTCPS